MSAPAFTFPRYPLARRYVKFLQKAHALLRDLEEGPAPGVSTAQVGNLRLFIGNTIQTHLDEFTTPQAEPPRE